MATDLERLVVSLEASITKYEKAMQKAVGVSNQRAKQVEDRWNKLNIGKQIGKGVFEGIVTGAAAAILPMLTLGAAISGTRAALEKFGDINDKSIAGGVTPEFFQGIAYQAKLSGVEIDGVAGALATFAKNSGLAAEGKGRMVTALQALNPELLKNIQAATTQEQRVKLVADAIKNAKDQAQAAAIASAAFGDQGVRLVAAFSGGAKAIDETIAKAKALGIIVSNDVVANADELGDKFDTVSQIIDNQLKQALVNLGPELVYLIGLVAEWAKDLNIVLDQMKGIEDRTVINPLQNRLVELENRLTTIKPLVDGLQKSGVTGGMQGVQLIKEYNDGLAEALRLQERIAQLQGKPKDNLAPKPKTFGASPDERQAANDALPVAPTTFDFRNVLDTAPKKVEAVTGSVGRLTNAVQVDNSAFEALQQQVETVTQLGQSFTDSFVGGILDGKSAIDSVSDALDGLARQLLQMVTDKAIQSLVSSLFGIAGTGSGPTGGAMGTGFWGTAAFGGGRAGGGPVQAGKVYKINENTPNSEYWMPTSSGIVIPRLPTGASSGGAAARPQVNVQVINNASDQVDASASVGSDGSLEVLIDKVVARKIGDQGSRTSGAMRQNFGLRTATARR